MQKRLRLIVGPNGSGKSTLFVEIGKHVNTYSFINADKIKKDIESSGCYYIDFDLSQDEMINHVLASSFDENAKQPFRDNKITVDGKKISFTPDAINSYSIAAFADFLRNSYIKRGVSFSAETVFSHPTKLDFLKMAKQNGYKIYIYFISTSDPRLNIERVKQRVEEGGHDVPQDKITSRYDRCMKQFADALLYADRAFFWDNSTTEMVMFAELTADHRLEIIASKIPEWFKKYVIMPLDLIDKK